MKNANGDPSNIRLERKKTGLLLYLVAIPALLLLGHLISQVGKTNIMPCIHWRKIMMSGLF